MRIKLFLSTLIILSCNYLHAQKTKDSTSVIANEIICSGCNGVGTIKIEKTCKNCSGNGVIICDSCSGNGKRTCKACGGTGQGDIYPTKGIYSSKCSTCSGAGSIKCKTCSGEGSFICNECNGKKIISTTEVCKICNGNGKISDALQINDAISEQTEVLYNLKANDLDIRSNIFLKHWLETYDKVNFKSYSSNEFELNKKMAELKNNVSNALTSLKYTDIYTAKKDVEFGDYDFASKTFKFQPFAEEFLGNPEGVINKKNYFFNYAGFPRMHYRSSFILVSNISDFQGLLLDEKTAQQLLNYKTKNGKIDRHLTIKAYYSLTDSVLRNYADESDGLYCFVYRIEVWGDKCANEALITVMNAKTSPPSYLENTKSNFAKLYSNGAVESNNYKGVPESDNYKSIISWSQYNDNCEREEFEMHVKKLKTQSEQQYLLIRLYTNYNYHIKPGFVFSFYNKETGVEFPLVIYETGVEKGAALLKLKITKQTLSQIVNSNCYCFKLQLNGSPKYSLSGEGVHRNLNVIKQNLSIADYYLGDQHKSDLFSILKQ